jgi:hypothetical protein
MKIRPVGADIIHAEGQMDTRKIKDALRKFFPRLKTLRYKERVTCRTEDKGKLWD